MASFWCIRCMRIEKQNFSTALVCWTSNEVRCIPPAFVVGRGQGIYHNPPPNAVAGAKYQVHGLLNYQVSQECLERVNFF